MAMDVAMCCERYDRASAMLLSPLLSFPRSCLRLEMDLFSTVCQHCGVYG